MEQKRTLWIVAAAGIFLLAVVGAALILYSPSLHQPAGVQAGFDPASGWISSTKQGEVSVPENTLAFTTETTAPADQTSALTPSPFTAFDNVNDTQKIAQADNTLHADKLTVISDNATVYSNETTTIDLNSLKASSGNGIVAKNEMTANQINTNRQVEKKTYEEPAPVAENYYAPAPSTKKAVAKKETPKAKTSSSKAAVAKTTETKAAAAKKVAAAAKKTPDSFWVQAAAYTSKRNADEARTTLESNKIPSEVFTFTDSNGKTFYRVRVGPYVTKSEAEYWQTRIGMIDKFASSKSVIVNTSIN